MTGIRVWISRTKSFGSPVMIVQERSHSSFAGSFHPSHKPAKHEWRIVLHADRIRNFAARNFLLFVGTIDRNQTAPFLERLAVGRRCISGLDSGVDGLVRNLGIAQYGTRPAQSIGLLCNARHFSFTNLRPLCKNCL